MYISKWIFLHYFPIPQSLKIARYFLARKDRRLRWLDSFLLVKVVHLSWIDYLRCFWNYLHFYIVWEAFAICSTLYILIRVCDILPRISVVHLILTEISIKTVIQRIMYWVWLVCMRYIKARIHWDPIWNILYVASEVLLYFIEC